MRVKEEFRGIIITRQFAGLGNITVDTDAIAGNAAKIKQLISLGFGDLFEEDVPEKCEEVEKYLSIDDLTKKEIMEVLTAKGIAFTGKETKVKLIELYNG
jgi:hypothetical protein